jgi:hypothetical protein
MTRRRKIFAGLAALAVVVVGIIVPARKSDALLTLSFVQFETNHTATFVIENRSSAKIEFISPSAGWRAPNGEWIKAPSSGPTSAEVAPRTTRALAIAVPTNRVWRASLVYAEPSPLADSVEGLLSRVGLRGSFFSRRVRSVDSQWLTNAPPVP